MLDGPERAAGARPEFFIWRHVFVSETGNALGLNGCTMPATITWVVLKGD